MFEVGLFIDQWAGYVSMLRALIIALLIRFRCWFRACRVLHERDGTDLIILKTGKARVAYWSYIRILKELCTNAATRLLIWVCVDCNKNTNFCIALKCLKPGK